MAGTTSVNVPGMAAAQAGLENCLGQCTSAYNNMTEQQSSLSANWTGQAATAFVQAVGNFLDDLNGVRTNLNNVISTMSANSGVYNAADNTTTSTATSYGSGLPGF